VSVRPTQTCAALDATRFVPCAWRRGRRQWLLVSSWYSSAEIGNFDAEAQSRGENAERRRVCRSLDRLLFFSAKLCVSAPLRQITYGAASTISLACAWIVCAASSGDMLPCNACRSTS